MGAIAPRLSPSCRSVPPPAVVPTPLGRDARATLGQGASGRRRREERRKRKRRGTRTATASLLQCRTRQPPSRPPFPPLLACLCPSLAATAPLCAQQRPPCALWRRLRAPRPLAALFRAFFPSLQGRLVVLSPPPRTHFFAPVALQPRLPRLPRLSALHFSLFRRRLPSAEAHGRRRPLAY